MINSKTLGLVAAIIFAFAFTALDFDNLSWSHNIKSYIGIVLAFVVFAYGLFLKKKDK